MKRLFKHYIIILFASTTLITATSYSQTSLENIELNTQRSIRKLNSKINSLENKDTLLINNLQQLSKSATTLFQKIRNDETLGRPSDSVFINTLEESQSVMEQLIDNWSSNEEVSDIMEDIKTDYEIKINSSPLGASSKVITNIEVTVTTKSDNQYVSGYDVYYTYMWDAASKRKKQHFNNKTNNAIRNLAPGYYFFWIERNGVIIQSKPKVEIGNLMLPKETLFFDL